MTSNTNENVKINAKYKDRLFRMLFGSEEYKENILSLYNALYDANYQKVDDLELVTLEDVIYIKMKNDAAFLLDARMSLWEEQSSLNPNMPLRGLMYFANLFSKYIVNNQYNIYGTKQIPLPTPQYVVFYNGTAQIPEKSYLHLSDAFVHPSKDGEFEWTATVINLNRGNDGLRTKCKTLDDYIIFTQKVRKYYALEKDMVKAVERAVKECIQEGVLAEFLRKHRAEVLNVCITEFDEELFRKGMREEGLEEGIRKGREEGIQKGREEGIQKGREEGKIETYWNIVSKKIMTLEQVSKELKMTVPEFLEKVKEFGLS